jgi:uncharacterized protein YycO
MQHVSVLWLVVLILFTSTGCWNASDQNGQEKPQSQLRNGDIMFQQSRSAQSKAIRLATGSKYTHMGILYKQDGQWQVLEASKKVQLTPFDQWIRKGKNHHYVVKRLNNAESRLTDQKLKSMKRLGQQYLGRPYDLYFQWSNDKMYCSELVWKLYDEAGIQIGQLQQLGSFNLSEPEVRQKLEKRYGSDIPMDERVIAPSAMFESDKLKTVVSSQ